MTRKQIPNKLTTRQSFESKTKGQLMTNLKNFWKQFDLQVFQKTGRPSLSIGSRNFSKYNKFVKTITDTISKSKNNVKILGLKITKDQSQKTLLIDLLIQYTDLKTKFTLIQLDSSNALTKAITIQETSSKTKKDKFLALVKSKNLSSKKDYYRKEYNEMLNLIGIEAMTALIKRQASLQVYRNSVPHNWWIEDNQSQTLWHRDSELFSTRPNINLFEEVSDSKESVSYGNSFIQGADSGLSQQSGMILSPEVCNFFSQINSN